MVILLFISQLFCPVILKYLSNTSSDIKFSLLLSLNWDTYSWACLMISNDSSTSLYYSNSTVPPDQKNPVLFQYNDNWE